MIGKTKSKYYERLTKAGYNKSNKKNLYKSILL